MAQDFTTTNYILPSLKARGLTPTAASTFQDTDHLRFLNDALFGDVVPSIMTAREEHFVRRQVDTPIVQGQDTYPIPERSIASTLRDVQLLDSTGQGRNLEFIEPDRVVGSEATTGTPDTFFLEGNNIVVRPVPDSTPFTLRMPIRERPNSLVLLSAVAQVASVASNVVTTVATIPGTFTTATALDMVQAKKPFGTLARDVVPSGGASGTTLTFAVGTVPAGLQAGDFICLSQESPVAQIPSELLPTLVLRAVAAELFALNMGEKASAQSQLADMLEKKAMAYLSSRAGETKKVKNGFDKWRSWSWGWGFGWRLP